MHITRKFALGLILSASLLSCGALSAQQDKLVEGQTVTFNGAQVRTWAKLSGSGEVVQVGVTVPYAAVQSGANGHTTGHQHPEIIVASVPEQVREQTFVDHVELDWMPGGHEPERYMTSHLDLHFYGVDAASVAAIDCTDLTQPDPSGIPDGWMPAVPPTLPDPSVACVPNMGYHAMPATEFDGFALKPGLFDKVMVAGFYGGAFTFFEPMITKATLERKENFSLPVPQPKQPVSGKAYPGKFDVVFDQQANAYRMYFSEFKQLK